METYQWDKLRESAAQKGMASAKGRKKHYFFAKSTFPRLSPDVAALVFSLRDALLPVNVGSISARTGDRQ